MSIGQRFHFDALHARLWLTMRARDYSLVERDLSELLRLIGCMDGVALSRCAYFKKWLQRVGTAHRLNAYSNRSARLPDQLAFSAFERLAQLAAVGLPGTVGVKRLERRLRLAVL